VSVAGLCISVNGLSKTYKRPGAARAARGLQAALLGRPAPQEEVFYALRDVSFTVRRGDRIGIIGRNGAGKSTLLKILSRVAIPSAGEIRIRGRLTSLLEVGTGFEREATGRTNIYLNAGLHGLSKREIDERFEDIVAFSGVRDFLDVPVKHYSSGMYVRLAFAVAAHLDPDILLLDEVLAVGDMAFQQKCLARIQSLTEDDSRTILFVTHTLGHVVQYCNKVVWLDNGQIRFIGDVASGIELYTDFMTPKSSADLSQVQNRKGTGRARITRVAFQADDGSDVDRVRTGAPVNVVVDWTADGISTDDRNDVFVNVIFANERKQRLFGTPNDATENRMKISNGTGRYRCRIERLPLLPGVYSYSVGILVDNQLVDKLDDIAHISVYAGDYYGTGKLPAKQFGDLAVDYSWSAESIGEPASGLRRD
jgi:lipopolysaccharide transport system ATP-binding protein